MAIAVRSSSGASTDGGGTITVTKPTGVAVGDVLFAIVTSDDNQVTSAPSGWSLISSTGATSRWMRAYRKVVTGTEAASYVWSFAGGVSGSIGIVCVSGADTTTPEDVTPTVRSVTTTGTSITAPTISPVTAGCLLITGHLARVTAGTATYTPPSGMTEQYDSGIQYAPTEVNTQQLTTAGATGTRVAICSRAAVAPGQTAVSIVVRPGGPSAPADDAQIPATLLNIGPGATQNHFDVQLARSGDADTDLRTMAQIAGGYEEWPYFYTSGNAVVMSVPLDAPVFTGTTPRIELREVDAAGVNAGYDANAGIHEMSGTSKITEASATTPEVVVAQLHNGAADRISIRTQLVSGTLRLRLRINGTSVTPELANPYVLGTEFSWKINVTNGAISVYYNDLVTPIYTAPAGTLLPTAGLTTWYFKTGAYSQTAGTSSERATVELSNLAHSHVFSQDFSGSLSIPSSGSLALSAASVATSRALSLSGSGTAALSGAKPAVNGSLTLSGAGTATRSGVPGGIGSLLLSGAGSNVLSNPRFGFRGPDTALSGSGQLVLAVQQVALTTSKALSGGATLASVASRIVVPTTGSIAVARSGSGQLSIVGKPGVLGELDLGGSSELDRTRVSIQGLGALAFDGEGMLRIVDPNALPLRFYDGTRWQPARLWVFNGRTWLFISSSRIHIY